MARIRSVHPELFLDDAFMELSPNARLLAIGIWTQCDDHGIFEWKPKYLKAVICPGDMVDVIVLMDELQAFNCIRPFDEDGRKYGAVRNFCLYQRPKKPVFKHPLPDWCRTYVAIDRQKAREIANQVPPKPPRVTPESPTSGEKPPHRRGEEGREEERREEPKTISESGESVPPPAPPVASKTLSPKKISGLAGLGSPLPADWVPDETQCERVKADFGMTDDDLRSELPAFHALNVSNGVMSQDWSATFYLFCKRWKDHKAKHPAPRVELNRASPGPFTPAEKDWDGCAAMYARTGRWSHQFGPDPMSVGCRCPKEILERHGINLETGERTIPPRKAVSA